MTLVEIARALGGEISAGQVLAPGPGHSQKDRSMWVRISHQATDGVLCGSFSGDDWRDCKDYVRQRLGLKRIKTSSRRREASDCPAGGTIQNKAAPLTSASADAERSRQALAIWAQSRDPRGTAVETYLLRRGLDLPAEASGEAIRFHPSCPFAGQRVAALVCLVRDIVTDEPRAIHRTALTLDGFAAEVGGKKRAALGPIGGGAIKLTPDSDVTLALGVGEGVESVLSLRNFPEFGPSPVWALISAGGVSDFSVLAGVESLWLAVDHDPAGIKASRSTATRWRAAEREAFLITPAKAGMDLNDLARRAA